MSNYPVLTKKALRDLLEARFSKTKRLKDIPSPSLLKDCIRGAKRTASAIRKNERICIIGDYDVDGVVSTAIMQRFFDAINVEVQCIIPNRFRDGYGLSPSLLEHLEPCNLIITVDNGIAAFEAAQRCKEMGIELIITDHHSVFDELPEAHSIINPKQNDCGYPFKDICGAQVAWLFLAQLKAELGVNVNMGNYLQLLSFAIIADVMPLIDINHTLVKAGIEQMKTQPIVPVQALMRYLGKRYISAEEIAFQVAPRINAAGRLEDASLALRFLCAKSVDEALNHLDTLDTLNNLRKQSEQESTKKALLHADEENFVNVVYNESFNEGIVGIIASRLVDHYGKPAIVLTQSDGLLKGSARSIGEVNIYELLKHNAHLLQKFGGHKMAAGLSLEPSQLHAFTEQINAHAQRLPQEQFLVSEELLGTLAPGSIDFELLQIIEAYEPYGEANPRPKFYLDNAQVLSHRELGSDGRHAKITLKAHPQSGECFDLLIFNKLRNFECCENLSCSYTLSLNEFNNKKSIQLLFSREY